MNNGQSKPVRPLVLNAFAGATVCFIVVGIILGVLAYLVRLDLRYGINPLQSLFYYGPLMMFFAAFSTRAFGWCGSRALLLAFVPIGFLTGPILGYTTGGCYPNSDIEGYVIWLCTWLFVIAVWAVGLWLDFLILKFVKTQQQQGWARWTVGTLCLLGLFLPVAIAKVEELYSSSHAAIAGPPALKCNAKDLHQTVVVATLDAPITKGTNLLWCATLQITWNELADLCGGTVDMVDPPDVVGVLNRKAISTNDLDATSFVAAAGPGRTIVPQIQAVLEAKFHGQASPELLRPVDGLFAYAYLFINLPFEWAFERLPFPLQFGTKSVECFGTSNLHNPRQDRAGRQLILRDYRVPDDLIIELQTRRHDHELVLAMVPPAETMEKTIRIVSERLRSSSGKHDHHWLLQIPVLNFDLTRTYEEICGHEVRGHGKSPFTMPLVDCIQKIRFRLDERGAVLKSEVVMTLGSPSAIRFDKPFLVLLRLRDRDNPYFALWVDNAEILVPSHKAEPKR